MIDYEDRLNKLETHHQRQIDENRMISRSLDKLRKIITDLSWRMNEVCNHLSIAEKNNEKPLNHLENLKNLSGTAFWIYFLKNKEVLQLRLDKNSTGVLNLIETEEEQENGFDSASARESIGCTDGLADLLTALGINFEYE